MLHHPQVLYWVFTDKDIFIHAHNTTSKFRKLTLLHCYHLILRFHSSFTSFHNNVFCNKKIWVRIEHYTEQWYLFSFLQSGTFLQSFFDFHDFDTLEEYRSVILWNISQFEFSWCSLMIRVTLHSKDATSDSTDCILWGGEQFTCPSANDVHIGYLITHDTCQASPL